MGKSAAARIWTWASVCLWLASLPFLFIQPICTGISHTYLLEAADGFIASEADIARCGNDTGVLLNSGIPIATQKKAPTHLWHRNDLGKLAEELGLRVGIELGVYKGDFSRVLLSAWPSCEKLHLVDIWVST